MKTKKDYYAILNVEKDVTAEQLKKSYRNLALQYHPDKNKDKDAEEKFKEINEAYSILSDEDKRSHYDRFGNSDNQRNDGSWFGGNVDPRDVFNHFRNMQGDPNFESLFEDDMGSAKNKTIKFSQKPINPDIRMTCNISLKDAIKGGNVTIEVNRHVACEECKTVGVKNVEGECKTCDGHGWMARQVQGHILIRQQCPSCQGTGKKINACDKCKGSGYDKIKEELSITIPKGVLNKTVLRLKDKGHVTYHNDIKISGSIFLVVEYPQHEEGIDIKDGNLHISVNIPINSVMAEEKIKINVLGTKKIHFQLDSSKFSGHVYEIKEEGIDKTKSAYVKVFIDLPKNDISDENKKKLISLMGDIYGEPATSFKPSTV